MLHKLTFFLIILFFVFSINIASGAQSDTADAARLICKDAPMERYAECRKAFGSPVDDNSDAWFNMGIGMVIIILIPVAIFALIFLYYFLRAGYEFSLDFIDEKFRRSKNNHSSSDNNKKAPLTKEEKADIVKMYLATSPAPDKDNNPIITELGEKYDRSSTSIRGLLSREGVYVKRSRKKS